MAKPFQGDDVDPFETARDKEGNVKQTGLAPTAKLSSFGAAFNAARRSGDKTFTWKGKKYTTEMAKPKAAPKAAPKASKADEKPMTRAEFDKAEAEDRLAEANKAKNTYESQQGHFGSFKKGGKVMKKISEYGGMEKYASKAAMKKHEAKETPMEEKMEKKMGKNMARAQMQKVASKAVKRHEKTMHGMKKGGMACGTKKYATGGSVRGDGCAQRGKTKGRMV